MTVIKYLQDLVKEIGYMMPCIFTYMKKVPRGEWVLLPNLDIRDAF